MATIKKSVLTGLFLFASGLVWLPLSAKPRIVNVKTLVDSESFNYEGFNALDGNPKTIWHTQFGAGEPGCPHEIIVDLGGSYVISGFSYLPRTDGCQNGTIKNYEFFVTGDRKNFGTPVVKSQFTIIDGENLVKFPSRVKGRYIKLRALSEVNGNPWTSIAELRIISGNNKFMAAHGTGLVIPDPRTELEIQYESLRHDLQKRKYFATIADQTFCKEALILDSDRDPLDVVLRRTRALFEDLKKKPASPPVLATLGEKLKKLETACSSIDPEKETARLELFKKACELRRQICFSNPLLNFNKILFIKHHRATFNHMCDQYYGINARPGGGLYVLSDPFGPNQKLRDVLAGSVVKRGRLKGQRLVGGSFLSPDLSYDAGKIMFAYVECKGDKKHRFHVDPLRGHWNEGRCYHLFSVNVDGSDLEQLTDGTWNDFDPCWLPNGRTAFITERRGGYLRCGRVCPTYTLFDMNSDGSDIICLSPHETNEWQPSVTHNGMIIYTRWDYIDRYGCVAHLPWITTPDGCDSRAVHGNFAPRELRADMELDIRAIPGSSRFVATGAPHHGQAFGSLVMFDPNVFDDNVMAPVKRLTPEIKFPETQGGSQVYGTAWPLSEKYYLCVYDVTMRPGMGRQGRRYMRGNYGIYLVDVFGNKELIYRDPTIACQNPVPLRPREKPPVVPAASVHKCGDKPHTATLGVVNVYDSTRPWPKGTEIKALRVYQVIPMSVPSGAPPHETGLRLPTARDSVNPVRYVLGTVPVEKDGSAYFTVPAMKELFFQALDKDGLAIQSMRSATYLQPGERLVCEGCHEHRYSAREQSVSLPLAFNRKPSTLKPDVDGTNPFSYPRLVQPVLDKNCVACHQKNSGKAPRLDREVIVQGRKKWYASYFSLAPKYGFWKYGDRFNTIPGKFGARASKLYSILKKDHYGVKLSKEDLHRITVWLDSSSLFYGVYEKKGGEEQLRGEIAKPTLE